MYDFNIYGGKRETNEEVADFCHLDKSAQVVARLCRNLPYHAGHKLYFDNWFTMMGLLVYLKDNGILACGTVRSNRIQRCPLKNNKELEKGRPWILGLQVRHKFGVGSGKVVGQQCNTHRLKLCWCGALGDSEKMVSRAKKEKQCSMSPSGSLLQQRNGRC